MSHHRPRPQTEPSDFGPDVNPVPNTVYKSTAPGPEGQILYLNGDASGSVTVEYDISNDSVWVSHMRNEKDVSLGFALVNLNGRALAMINGGQLTTQPFDPGLPDAQAWTVAGYDVFAMRPFLNDDLNLNVRGDGPYPAGTEVILFHWDNQANSKWTLDH
jgi:hypothetical protein